MNKINTKTNIMKKLTFLAAIAIGFMITSCTGNAQENQTQQTVQANKIEVIDFYSTHRCMTCNAIEANTIYTLEKYFTGELESGTITFKTVNVDEDENFNIAEKFEASGTALFLNVIVNGKETQINLTDFAFMNGNDQETFSLELKKRIEKQLQKL